MVTVSVLSRLNRQGGFAMEYTYKFKCTLNYYGYPQAQRRYEISSTSFDGSIVYYGNNGFDLLEVKNDHHKCNGYFWQMRLLLKTIYSNGKENNDLREKIFHLKEGEEVWIKLSD